MESSRSCSFFLIGVCLCLQVWRVRTVLRNRTLNCFPTKKLGKKRRDHHWISDRINPTSFKVMIAEVQVLARREESQPMHSCNTWGCSGKPWQGLKNDRMPNWFGKSTSEKTPKLQPRSPWELCTHAHWSLAHNAKKCDPVSTDTPV